MTPGVAAFPGDDAEDVKAVQNEHFRAAARALVARACDGYRHAEALLGVQTPLGARIKEGLRYEPHLFWKPIAMMALAFRRDVWIGAQGDLFRDFGLTPAPTRREIIEREWWQFLHDAIERVIALDVTLTRLIIRIAAETDPAKAAQLSNLLGDVFDADVRTAPPG